MLAARRSQCQIPSGMTQRFIARARSEGIEMSRGTTPKRIRRNQPVLIAALGIVAAVVLIVGILTIRKTYHSTSLASQAPPPVPQASVAAAVPSPTSRVRDAELQQQQLTAAQKEVNSLAATIRSQRDELEALGKVKDSLNSQLIEAERQNTGFKSEKSDWEARATQLQEELEKSRADKGASDVALTLAGDRTARALEEVR